MNDILWRATKRVQLPTAVKEPVNLLQYDGKRPDGTTLLSPVLTFTGWTPEASWF